MNRLFANLDPEAETVGGLLAGLADAYRLSDNVQDRRRPFAPLWRGGAVPSGSPSAVLFKDQAGELSHLPGGVADDFREWSRDWLDANIMGRSDPRIDPGLSTDPLDVALRRYVSDALAFQLTFGKRIPQREPFEPSAADRR